MDNTAVLSCRRMHYGAIRPAVTAAQLSFIATEARIHQKCARNIRQQSPTSALLCGKVQLCGSSRVSSGDCVSDPLSSDFNPRWQEIGGRQCFSLSDEKRKKWEFFPKIVRAGHNQHAGKAGLGVSNMYNLNLSEYMVTLNKPLGVRFAQTLDGKVYVEALAKQGNAENTRMIMVGDVLKKTSAVSGDDMWDVEDVSRTMHAIKNRNGSVSLVLERPASPVHIHPLVGDRGISFNCGRVAVATWDKNNLIMDPEVSGNDAKNEGNAGFSVFSRRFLRSRGLKALAKSMAKSKQENGIVDVKANCYSGIANTELSHEIVTYFSDEGSDGVEWTHGNFPIEEYTSAVKRAEKDLCYNHSMGMQCTKITGDIFVGSCIQTVTDVETLAKDLGITAILNFQTKSEQINWGINGEAIEHNLNEQGLLAIHCPIREVDSVDLRRKLPYAVGVLYRLLRQEHRVFVTCTTGLDRSPACVIAYLHWIRDWALQDAVDFVYRIHPCGPDRPALVWATWDLIAMAEKDNHKGPPTHAVQFVWNHGCREGEEVLLVGDFKGEWNDPIKSVHAGGPKYIADLRLPQGKYYYKFIVGGHWRHSNSLPTEVDKWGNVNNVVHIGDVATTNFNDLARPNVKALTSIKVIERPLTEDERFTLAFAARRMAFSISPIRFTPKS